MLCERMSTFRIVMFEDWVECVDVRNVPFGCVFTDRQK